MRPEKIVQISDGVQMHEGVPAAECLHLLLRMHAHDVGQDTLPVQSCCRTPRAKLPGPPARPVKLENPGWRPPVSFSCSASAYLPVAGTCFSNPSTRRSNSLRKSLGT